MLVDDDRRVRHGIEHRAEMRLARPQIACGSGRGGGCGRLLAGPGDADADDGEDHRFDDLRPAWICDAADEDPRDQTERSRHQARAQSAGARREQNGRDEQEEFPSERVARGPARSAAEAIGQPPR